MSEQIKLPEACADIRRTIQEDTWWINNTDQFLDEDELGYADQRAALDLALRAIRTAFKERPQSCEMIQTAEDTYECGGCFFEEKIGVFDL